MKRFLSLLTVAFMVSACNYNIQPVQQRWFLGSQDFQGKTPSMSLKISHADMNGSHIRLFAHVIDTNHFHYQGISPTSFCNASVHVDYFKPYNVNNLQITEHKKTIREPMAVAFVLDYSGSMTFRKETLYNLTQKLIDQKREQDAYSIVRYGTYSSLDVHLTQDKYLLKNEFQPQPRKSISSSTATWDAIAEGVASLENSPYEEKVLIVLTDGGENASVTTKEWAFWKAKTAGVKVMAVSLGKAGETNMKDLCEQTGGMYTYINNIEEWEQAFTDFQNKLSSYYLIEFETPLIGKQTVRLNLCDNIALSGQYTFDNSPTSYEPVRYKDTPPNYVPPTEPSPRKPTPSTTAGNTGSPRIPTSSGTRTPTSNTPSTTTNGGGRVSTPSGSGNTRTPVNTNGSSGRTGTGDSKPVSTGRGTSQTPSAQP